MNIRNTLLLLIAFLVSSSVFAQTLKGKVVSTDQKPLPGVLIQIPNSNKAVVTDENGNFDLSSKNEVLVKISLVGYISKEVRIQPSTPVTVTLEEDIRQLQETIVYGKTETAAIRENSIKTEVIDLKQSHSLPVNISELMNRSSGIRIRQTGGLGSATDVNLNGFQGKSIRYFRDGIPMDYLGDGFSLSSLPVNMLERIEIYKGVLPVSLGADALGGGVNLVGRKLTKNFADVSYEIGSFNTHRANINTYFSRDKFFYGADAFFNHSDNNYKVTVKVTDPDTRNQTDANVNLFHNAYTGYFGQAFAGFRNLNWADEIRFDLAAFQFTREQQHPALMTEPYGAVLSRQTSVIPSLKYEKQIKKVTINQFLALNTLTINRIDTLKGSYDWFGNFTPNPLKIGESRQPSLSDIKNNHFTSRTNLKYRPNDTELIELNQVITQAKRQGNDPYGPRFNDTDVDVLSLPLTYQKFITTLGLNSDFGKFENLLMLKYFMFKSSGIETFQSREINTTDARTINGKTWGLANALKYKLTDLSFIRLSGEYSNRLPDHTEIFGDAVWIVQNFSIRPERSLNFNLGWKTAIRNKYSLELNAFYRRTKDMILLVPIQAPYARFENQQNVKGFGFEADGSFNLYKGISLTANATYQEMRLFNITDSQEAWKNDARLRNTPYLFGNAGINYQSQPLFNSKINFRAFAFYSYLHEYFLETIPQRLEGKGLFGKASVNSQLIIPDQHLVNAGFLVSLPTNRIGVGFDVKNLTDSKVFDNYRVQRAGRSFHLKINYSIL